MMICRLHTLARHVSLHHRPTLVLSPPTLTQLCCFGNGGSFHGQPSESKRAVSKLKLADENLLGDDNKLTSAPIEISRRNQINRSSVPTSMEPFFGEKGHAKPKTFDKRTGSPLSREKPQTRLAKKPRSNARMNNSYTQHQRQEIKDCGIDWKRALLLLRDMEQNETGASLAARNAAIGVCARAKQPDEANLIFLAIRSSGLEPDEVSYSGLMSASAKVGNWETAFELLGQMEEADGLKPDVFNYSAVITACEKSGQWDKALQILKRMETNGVAPNVVSLSSAISACEKGGQSEKALELFESMVESHGIEPNVYTFNAVISACGRIGRWEKALELLNSMQDRGVKPNIVNYSAAISACEKSGEWEKSLDIFYSMRARGVRPNDMCLTAAISSCEKGGKWEKALELFESLKSYGIAPNVYSFSATISACGKGGQWEKALELLNSMQDRGVEPNVISYNATISACEKGRQWEKALEVFNAMEESKARPNVITFSAAISACEKCGQWERALEIFNAMGDRGVLPNSITFGAAITACGKSGRWEEALKIFNAMEASGISFDESPVNACIEALDAASRIDEAMSVMSHARRRGLYPKVWFSDSTIDLHGCPSSVMRTVMRCVMSDLKEKIRKPAPDLCIIIGQGHNSGESGAVLPDKLRAFLDEFGVPVTEVPNNPGRLVLKSEDLIVWMGLQSSESSRENI